MQIENTRISLKIKTLNRTLENAIKKNGIDSVIAWLTIIEKDSISEDDILSFKNIKKITLKVLNIRIIKNNDEKSTDAKILIVAIISLHKSLKIRQLANLLKVSENSIFYYKKQFKNRQKYKSNYNIFFEKYNNILNQIQNERK